MLAPGQLLGAVHQRDGRGGVALAYCDLEYRAGGVSPGSSEFMAAAAILSRIQPDIVALNEVSGRADIETFQVLAERLAYPFVVVSLPGQFGGLHHAVLSRYPVLGHQSWGSGKLSPDPAANDLTRYLFAADIAVSGPGYPLRVLALHLKPGSNAGQCRHVRPLCFAPTIG